MKKAFTLIELLVVIAIIAILAAILFPVFAQAKDAAKSTALISNFKQVGLGVIMYSSDVDDAFPLMWSDDPEGVGNWSWQGKTQPYTKNWGIFTNPKLPPPSGPQAYWQRLQYFGSLMKYEGVSNDGGTYSTGWINGAGNVQSKGLMGLGAEMYDAKFPNPSITQSSVNNISDNVMVVESGSWDMLNGIYGSKNPFGSCYGAPTWGAGWSIPVGGQWNYAGPHVTKNVKGDRSGFSAGCNLPDGLSTYVATDGSAKAVDFRGRMMEVATKSDGTKVFKRFWPEGL